jgi:hypothetical protein
LQPPGLKLETRPKLHSAKIVGSGGYGSKSSISGPEIRETKALVIEAIKHLRAYLEYLTFADLELLGEGRVQIGYAIASQVREMTRRIAGNVVTGISEAALIQVRSS